MPYLLKHHFDPDFDYLHLSPRERSDGSVDHHDLGYVQNVVRDQVVAELEQLPQDAEPAPEQQKYVRPERTFPAGPGTVTDPSDPLRLLAEHNGYVFYNPDGLIQVKRVLNVRRDVDYNTGNVAFVGDLVVHGAVRSGFRLRAGSVRIKETVEGARITAMGDILCESGIKGAGEAVLQSTRTIKAAFSENATLVAKENVLIEGSVLHNQIYAGHKLAVKGRFTGGEIYCLDYAYIGGQLGGGIGAATQVLAGYDPLLLYADQKLNVKIKDVRREIDALKHTAAKGPAHAQEVASEIEDAQGRLASLLERKVRVWEGISATESLASCRVMVVGTVKPGVEISIGNAYYQVDEEMEDVCFYFSDNGIRIKSPAIEK